MSTPWLLQRQRVAEHVVKRYREHQVHEPQPGADFEEAMCTFRPAADSGQVGSEAGGEVGGVDAGQTDEQTANWVVTDLEEDDDPEDRLCRAPAVLRQASATAGVLACLSVASGLVSRHRITLVICAGSLPAVQRCQRHPGPAGVTALDAYGSGWGRSPQIIQIAWCWLTHPGARLRPRKET